MPLFFFHVVEGDASDHDNDGTDLPDLAAAENAAQAAIGELVGEAVKTGDRNYETTIEVVDEAGSRILSLSATCRVISNLP